MSDATVLMASPTVGCFLICGGLCATACAADTISLLQMLLEQVQHIHQQEASKTLDIKLIHKKTDTT